MVDLEEMVARALAEDVGAGDVTSEATVPEGAGAGADRAEAAWRRLRAGRWSPRRCGSAGWRTSTTSSSRGSGGRTCRPRSLLASGPAPALLAAERTALNFLGHLSGVATLTARFVEAVAGTGARILDTRKTTPGLRALEKAAVAAGGGRNHRMGLYDAILIKENHIALAGGASPRRSTRRARRSRDLAVEVECRNLDEVAYALGTGADRLLLDNMDAGGAARGGRAARRASGAAEGPSLEASGGVEPRNRPRDRRDRRRLHLRRRPDPLGADARLQLAARAGPEASHLSRRERRRSLRTRPPVCAP